MTPEQVFGKLNKDIKGLTSGVASASVSGSSIIFTMNDGSTQTITFPQPKDGASIVAVSTNENNQFVFSMSDGTEIVGGEVPASSGVSKEYVDSELSKKANNSDIPTKVSGLQNDSNYQTDTDVATALTPYAKSADVTKEITNKVAEIIADAPEDFNTLKEMSDWISNHENDASAMNSAISDNKTAITALQTDKADKSEIPTTLPANGGNADTVNNHTVETDVPTDAVFTDTIYDDTEVKGSIEGLSSNLDGLEFGEVAGGKNLLNPIWKTSSNNGVNFINNGDGSFTIKGTPNTANSSYSESILIPVEVGKSYKLTGNCISAYKKDDIQSILENNSTTSESTFTATEDAVNICLYVGANTDNIDITSKYMLTEATNTSEYEPYIPSVKELAEGKADKSETTVNLLKPTLQTSTSNGITCTNNGDGTYTFNGTATAEATFIVEYIGDIVTKYVNKDLRLVGCPKNGSKNTYRLQIWSDSQEPVYDFGDGVKIHIKKATGNANVAILFGKDITVNNLVFKPMLTTNLSTTYDDFVPYTGDSGSLNWDVAQLRNDLSPKRIELQNVDERVTIKDNGSFIINGFAFVNLLVTFKETLPQWSNFVRLPRPKNGTMSVYCENSVEFTIYSQDNLPGDCGTYDEVSSGTEVRLLVNYEVA